MNAELRRQVPNDVLFLNFTEELGEANSTKGLPIPPRARPISRFSQNRIPAVSSKLKLWILPSRVGTRFVQS